jgi:large subunit ribosomal protein L17
MRHLKSGYHLNRTRSHRRAMLSNLSAALFEHKRIKTTLAKAKATRSVAERFITFAKKGDLASRRRVLRYIPQKRIVKILFDEIAPMYDDRPGGYSRIVKLGQRMGDGAPLAMLELVGFETKVAKKKAAKKKGEKPPAKPEKEAEVEEETKAKKAAKPRKKAKPKAAEEVVEKATEEGEGEVPEEEEGLQEASDEPPEEERPKVLRTKDKE